MTITIQCGNCLRYRGDLTCDAFPERIPEMILTGFYDHTIAYEGDGGKKFKPIPENEMEKSFEDYTETIADKDDAKYEAVRLELMKLGYEWEDFEEGGALYGWSTNELIDLAKKKGEQ